MESSFLPGPVSNWADKGKTLRNGSFVNHHWFCPDLDTRCIHSSPIQPFLTLLIGFSKFHLISKFKKKNRQRVMQLHVGKTDKNAEYISRSCIIAIPLGCTYFIPMHCLQPLENGTNYVSSSMPLWQSQRPRRDCCGEE